MTLPNSGTFLARLTTSWPVPVRRSDIKPTRDIHPSTAPKRRNCCRLARRRDGGAWNGSFPVAAPSQCTAPDWCTRSSAPLRFGPSYLAEHCDTLKGRAFSSVDTGFTEKRIGDLPPEILGIPLMGRGRGNPHFDLRAFPYNPGGARGTRRDDALQADWGPRCTVMVHRC